MTQPPVFQQPCQACDGRGLIHREPRTLGEWMRASSTTQSELAKKVGVAQSRVHSWIAGAYPAVKHWPALVKATGLPPAAFVPPDVAALMERRA